MSMQVSANYFEANNMCGPGRGHPACKRNLNNYILDGGSGSGLNQSINADIVLNGVIDNMGDPKWYTSAI
jgi:hypothetical protein